MPLRVLHLIQYLRGYGAERQVFDLIPYLQDQDLAAGVLSVYTSGLTLEERQALPFTAIDVGRRSRSDFTFIPRLVREIKKFAPDIVHTHTHTGKYWGRVAAWLAGVRTVVYTEHNPCDPRRSRIERLADPFLHARTSRIVTFLHDQRHVLAQTDRVMVEKIHVIPNGLALPQEPGSSARNAARRALGVRDDQYAILLVGRLEYQKNEALALRALAAAPVELRKKMTLYLAGAGSDELMLRGLSRALDIEEHVRFLGYRKDVQCLLPGADLLLMTSLFEGMPLTLIEAMIAGVPILTTPWTGASEMLGNGRCGFIARDWSPENVARDLVRALTYAHGRAEVVRRARAYAREAFDIRSMAQAHRKLYFQLCGGAA